MAAVVPFMDEMGIEMPAHLDEESGAYVVDCPFPAAFDGEKREWDLGAAPITWDEVLVRWRAHGPMNRDYVKTIQRGYRTMHDLAAADGSGRRTGHRHVCAAIWEALRHVEDPEIPISVIGMGLIVSVGYEPNERRADLQITYTAMGCPAMEFIEEDITDACLAIAEVDDVAIEVVWDPVWTKDRLRAEARATMRQLGIAV